MASRWVDRRPRRAPRTMTTRPIPTASSTWIRSGPGPPIKTRTGRPVRPTTFPQAGTYSTCLWCADCATDSPESTPGAGALRRPPGRVPTGSVATAPIRHPRGHQRPALSPGIPGLSRPRVAGVPPTASSGQHARPKGLLARFPARLVTGPRLQPVRGPREPPGAPTGEPRDRQRCQPGPPGGRPRRPASAASRRDPTPEVGLPPRDVGAGVGPVQTGAVQPISVSGRMPAASGHHQIAQPLPTVGNSAGLQPHSDLSRHTPVLDTRTGRQLGRHQRTSGHVRLTASHRALRAA